MENNFIADFFDIDKEILEIFLMDMSSKKTLVWGTDNYKKHGFSYAPENHMTIDLLRSRNKWLIEPRVYKSKTEQKKRSKDMAEVFTPSWVCNEQNNLVDNEWFGYEGAFNHPTEDHKWISTDKVNFKDNKWEDYVNEERMEITCGEAPYLTSRYDTVNGGYIETKDRIGLLDRKLRVINENVESEEEWMKWTLIAIKRIYGFDYQGDNVLISRINLLKDVDDFYKNKFSKHLTKNEQLKFAKIIVWNIWQMDGLKYVVPLSCHKETQVQMSLFGDEPEPEFCTGCKTGNNREHNGIYCVIKDWKAKKNIRFVDLVGGYSYGK